MTNNDLFDINLLEKRIIRAKKNSNYDQLLYKISAKNITEIISSYNRTFRNVLDLSFFSQECIYLNKNVENIESQLHPFDLNIIRKDNFQKYDLIISNLSIQSINNITLYLSTIHNLLKNGGIFIGSCFGSKTLSELKHSMIINETNYNLPHAPNIIPLLDIKKLGNLLQRINFKMPVVDSTIYSLEHSDIYNLCSELKKMAITNHMYKRRTNYLGKKYWNSLNIVYQELYSVDNFLQSSFEILSFTTVK